MTFTTTAPDNNSKGLALNISQGHGVIDRAIVRFGEGQTLPKFQLNRNSTKLFIPQDDKDYAVAVIASDSEAIQTELPLNFKAEKNGEYTIAVNSENMDLNYLHLIDNLTGTDVDLLAPVIARNEAIQETASYTFEAKTTDYESRFKLVFAVGSSTSSETFAFISNGELIVNGTGTLQVIDMMGHVIRTVGLSQCGSRTTTAGMTPGVYVLRLIDGDDVNTQKIIVQ